MSQNNQEDQTRPMQVDQRQIAPPFNPQTQPQTSASSTTTNKSIMDYIMDYKWLIAIAVIIIAALIWWFCIRKPSASNTNGNTDTGSSSQDTGSPTSSQPSSGQSIQVTKQRVSNN